MFELQSASAHYRDEIALEDITLAIPPGQKVALVGHSGSGKSTLLKLLFDQRPQDISLVPQDYGLVLTLSLFHNVYMGRLDSQPLWYNCLNLLRPMAKSVEQVRHVLRLFELEDKLFEPAGQLSGGQQQRAAMARAVYQDAAVLLADEPVSSLDEQQSKQVMQILCERFDTVVLALHDIDLALAYCDRIIGLKQGRIVIDAASDALNRNDLLALYGE